MTIEEFDNFRFKSGLKAMYCGNEYNIVQVGLGECLLALHSDDWADDDDPLWVRCESANVLNQA